MASGMTSGSHISPKEPFPHRDPYGWPHSKPAVVQKSPVDIINMLTTNLLNRGIGFTNHQLFFQELANQVQTKPTFPPHDIVKTGDETYEIRLAIAGFSKDELTITFKDQVLTIEGSKGDEDNEEEFIHKGIATRVFKQTFPLAEYVEIVTAEMKDGLLTVYLTKKIPDALRPKTIKIK